MSELHRTLGAYTFMFYIERHSLSFERELLLNNLDLRDLAFG